MRSPLRQVPGGLSFRGVCVPTAYFSFVVSVLLIACLRISNFLLRIRREEARFHVYLSMGPFASKDRGVSLAFAP